MEPSTDSVGQPLSLRADHSVSVDELVLAFKRAESAQTQHEAGLEALDTVLSALGEGSHGMLSKRSVLLLATGKIQDWAKRCNDDELETGLPAAKLLRRLTGPYAERFATLVETLKTNTRLGDDIGLRSVQALGELALLRNLRAMGVEEALLKFMEAQYERNNPSARQAGNEALQNLMGGRWSDLTANWKVEPEAPASANAAASPHSNGAAANGSAVSNGHLPTSKLNAGDVSREFFGTAAPRSPNATPGAIHGPVRRWRGQ